MKNTAINIRVIAFHKKRYYKVIHNTGGGFTRRYRTPTMTAQEFDLAFHFTKRDWLEEIRQGNLEII